MRKICLTIAFLSLFANLYAQNHNYKISGRIEGENTLKYALLYTSGEIEGKIKTVNIVDDKFDFSGLYVLKEPTGAITAAYVFLSEQEFPSDSDLITLSRSPLWRTQIMMEPQIDFVFNAQKKESMVEAGPLNKIQSVFSALYERYLKKIDSAHLSIDLENLDAEVKVKKKKDAKRLLFFEEKANELDLINKYPDSEVTLIHFSVFTMVPFFKDNRVRESFNGFSERIRQSKHGIRLAGFLTDLEQKIQKPNMINKTMPDFELAGLDGLMRNSKALYGKYTLVDFWASWCAPCRAENPTIIAAYNKYHQKGFNVIAISIDQLKDKGKWEAAIKKDKTEKFMQLFNPGGITGIAQELNINSIPASYLLDAEGKIIAVDLRGDMLEKKLQELMPL